MDLRLQPAARLHPDRVVVVLAVVAAVADGHRVLAPCRRKVVRVAHVLEAVLVVAPALVPYRNVRRLHDLRRFAAVGIAVAGHLEAHNIRILLQRLHDSLHILRVRLVVVVEEGHVPACSGIDQRIALAAIAKGLVHLVVARRGVAQHLQRSRLIGVAREGSAEVVLRAAAPVINVQSGQQDNERLVALRHGGDADGELRGHRANMRFSALRC